MREVERGEKSRNAGQREFGLGRRRRGGRCDSLFSVKPMLSSSFPLHLCVALECAPACFAAEGGREGGGRKRVRLCNSVREEIGRAHV